MNMEGVEFQIRSHQRHIDYPLALDQKILQGDTFRRAKTELEGRLSSIEIFYSSSDVEAHTGQADCKCCASRKRQIREAFSNYYLCFEPGRWDSDLHQYREEMERMIREESKYSLRDLHNFHEATLREHLKLDLCTPLSSDTSEGYALRRMISDMFDNDQLLEDIVDTFAKAQSFANGSQDEHDFVTQLQRTTNPEERVAIYTKYYCSPNWNDSPAIKNFKTKHARQFADLATHDNVLAAMHEDAVKTQSHQLEILKSELNDFQMAKSATMKHRKRRAEQADQRMLDRDAEGARYVSCGLPGCHSDVDLFQETTECGLCDWLARKDSTKKRTYYCSAEHAEDDFDEHDRNDHQCCMGSNCYFHPRAGPPGETGAGGVCPDCARHGIANYCCSQQCYNHNLESHRDEFHHSRNIPSDSTQLDNFKVAEDLKILI